MRARWITSFLTVVSLGLAATPAAAATARGIDRACPPDEVPEDGFTDVPPTNGHEAAVDCVVWWKVALGRSPSTYDPGAAVQRGEMASFLARLILEAGGELPSTERAPDAFTDDNGSTHETTTNQLAAAGVVAGTGGGRFDPAGSVTRAQMASFLVQALEYRTGTGLPAGPDAFADDNGTTHEVNINKAAAAGLTGGTASGGYDGDLPIRRDQLASFLARSLDLLVEQGWAARPGVAYIEPTHGDVCDPETGQCRAVPL